MLCMCTKCTPIGDTKLELLLSNRHITKKKKKCNYKRSQNCSKKKTIEHNDDRIHAVIYFRQHPYI